MADPLDVITEAQAFEALKGLRGSGDAMRVAGLVTAVSRRLDDACGPIVQRAVVETRHPAGGTVFLSGRPVGGVVTSVTETWSADPPETVAATEYVVEPDGRLSRWAGYWGSRVSVTYTAGRFATTADVEEPFVTAAGMLLQHLWRPANGGGSETYGLAPGFLATGVPSFGFPNAVADVLAGEMLSPAVA